MWGKTQIEGGLHSQSQSLSDKTLTYYEDQSIKTMPTEVHNCQ